MKKSFLESMAIFSSTVGLFTGTSKGSEPAAPVPASDVSKQAFEAMKEITRRKPLTITTGQALGEQGNLKAVTMEIDSMTNDAGYYALRSLDEQKAAQVKRYNALLRYEGTNPALRKLAEAQIETIREYAAEQPFMQKTRELFEPPKELQSKPQPLKPY